MRRAECEDRSGWDFSQGHDLVGESGVAAIAEKEDGSAGGIVPVGNRLVVNAAGRNLDLGDGRAIGASPGRGDEGERDGSGVFHKEGIEEPKVYGLAIGVEAIASQEGARSGEGEDSGVDDEGGLASLASDFDTVNLV